MYGADPFYAWFGLDSPKLYAAHKAAGGMTSVYRQIEMACERVFRRVLQNSLGLTEEQSHWSYEIPGTGDRKRKLSLDGRIEISTVSSAEKRGQMAEWLQSAAEGVDVSSKVIATLDGAVFEVRQGYKSKDAKRQNADIGMRLMLTPMPTCRSSYCFRLRSMTTSLSVTGERSG